MSFGGGGSDLLAYYEKFGGAVVSTAIDKYIYIAANPTLNGWTQISYTMAALESRILVFYTGFNRGSSAFLKAQNEGGPAARSGWKILHRMVQLAHDLRRELQNDNLDSFGEIVHDNWILKKVLSKGIATDAIDHWYRIARQNGAIGGKLLGAGGGGFLMFYAPPNRHEKIARHLGRACLEKTDTNSGGFDIV
jgi:galactokinase/mevalonate kinase-like predicted kinase